MKLPDVFGRDNEHLPGAGRDKFAQPRQSTSLHQDGITAQRRLDREGRHTNPLYHVVIAALPQQVHPEFLVVGAGVAGLRAAIELAAAGRVLVVTKSSLHESSSEYAQGGIAAAL